MTSMINIGGDASDISFRYKMPVLQVKTEGRGNGIKTILLNLSDVAKSLCVHPSYLTKFFSLECGCSSSDKNRFVLNGAHTPSSLIPHLNKFIKLFVLCPRCHLPEMSLSTKKDILMGHCAACGWDSSIKTEHKIISYLLKHISSNTPQSTVVSPLPNIIQEEEEKKEKEESQEIVVEWIEDTSKDAQELRWKEEMDQRSSPSTAIPLDLKTMIHQTMDSSLILSELRRLELARSLTPSQRIYLLLESLLDAPSTKIVMEQMEKHTRLLTRVLHDTLILPVFMEALEQLLITPQHSRRVPVILEKLYDMDLLSEDFILCWYDSPPESSLGISRSDAISLRQSATTFIQWLRQAEEDEE